MSFATADLKNEQRFMALPFHEKWYHEFQYFAVDNDTIYQVHDANVTLRLKIGENWPN